LPAVAEMAAVAAAAKGAAIQYVKGGGEDADEESGSNHGGGDDGHGTDEESKSSNPHSPSNNNGPAISQINVNGTLSVAISHYHLQQNNSKSEIIIRECSTSAILRGLGALIVAALPLMHSIARRQGPSTRA
jgi:hypothetical protein